MWKNQFSSSNFQTLFSSRISGTGKLYCLIYLLKCYELYLHGEKLAVMFIYMRIIFKKMLQNEFGIWPRQVSVVLQALFTNMLFYSKFLQCLTYLHASLTNAHLKVSPLPHPLHWANDHDYEDDQESNSCGIGHSSRKAKQARFGSQQPDNNGKNWSWLMYSRQNVALRKSSNIYVYLTSRVVEKEDNSSSKADITTTTQQAY